MNNSNSQFKIRDDVIDTITVFALPLITPSFYIAKHHNDQVCFVLRGNGEYITLSIINPETGSFHWFKIINGDPADLRYAEKDLERIHHKLPLDVDMENAYQLLLEFGSSKLLRNLLSAPDKFKKNYQLKF